MKYKSYPSKRLLDIIVAITGLLLFAPVMVLIALLIKLEDGGPVFFHQRRVGLFGKTFRIVKIRTMREGKVTYIGKWLRPTGIDELAQFWNVLLGDMSAVGPRPLTRKDVFKMGWDRPAYQDRWLTKPGISGVAQVYYAYLNRGYVFLDKHYVHHQNLWLDFQLVVLGAIINVMGKPKIRVWLKQKRKRRKGKKNGYTRQLSPVAAPDFTKFNRLTSIE